MSGEGSARWVFWAIAAACFAAAAAGLLARAANYMADRWAHESTGVAIVRVLASDDPAALAQAEEIIAAAPGVASAEIVTAERAAALLQDWGGQEVRASDLPPLRLIEVEFTLDAPSDAPRRLEALLQQRGLASQVIAPNANATQAEQSARTMRLAAAGGAGFFALMMAAIILLAARAMAQKRIDLITAMADIGATSAGASRDVGDEAASMGLWAGILGAGAAAMAAFAAIYLMQPSADALEIVTGAHWMDWAPIAATPIASALLASAGARGAAASLHARAARLA